MRTAIPSFVRFAKAPWNKGRLVGQKRPLRPKRKIEASRDRVLSDDELRAIWRAAEKLLEPSRSLAKARLITIICCLASRPASATGGGAGGPLWRSRFPPWSSGWTTIGGGWSIAAREQPGPPQKAMAVSLSRLLHKRVWKCSRHWLWTWEGRPKLHLHLLDLR